MMHKLRFLPDVEEDAFASYAWYETKSAGLGEDLLRMFYSKANEISRNPLIFQKVYNDFRRCLLRRFPYAIYFTITGSTIIVIGLFHCARDPQEISEALQNRHV
jgi:plasmid stabilization system protein ParE